MTIKINLSNVNDSPIKYDKIKYPDGQISIRFPGGLPSLLPSETFEIRSRMNSYEDLFYILAAKDALRHIYPYSKADLYISCFLGQRSDRRFSNFESFDLKIIVALVDYALSGIRAVLNCNAFCNPSSLVLVSPDAGAYKQVYKHANNHNISLIAANKCRIDRDRIDLEINGNVKYNDCLIIDDYIDGGRTFAILAGTLKDRGAAHVYLAVTHGLFSKGFDIPDVDLIFTTNSIQDIDHPKVKQIRVI
jgi:ribose-phosphate pyrophosphokinase